MASNACALKSEGWGFDPGPCHTFSPADPPLGAVPLTSVDGNHDAAGGHGSRVNASTWDGRTAAKWRRSVVMIVVIESRSAMAITLASEPPRGKSA